MSKTYNQFLKGKMAIPELSGFEVDETWLNPHLYLFQKDIVKWSLRLGKAAIFAQVGLGKTIMFLSYANCIAQLTNKSILILAPLAVSAQTIREAKKFSIATYEDMDNLDLVEKTSSKIGVGIKRVSNQDEVDLFVEDGIRIFITNYDKLVYSSGENKGQYRFDTSKYVAVILDESSILKSIDGKIKDAIIDGFANTPYKLACTATPAPNDHTELANHSEFLNVMPRRQMISKFFVHDSSNTQKWRLKKHASDNFWEWVTTWAVCLTKPSDLGDEYDMPEFELPPLTIIPYYVSHSQSELDYAQKTHGTFIPINNVSATSLNKGKKLSLDSRIEKCEDIVAAIDSCESIVIWCITNEESARLAKIFPDAIEVRGDTKDKEQKLLDFSDEKFRILITKTKIAGFGMNWQHCSHTIFFSYNFSFEGIYQAKGRFHRYGQTKEVFVHIIQTANEENITKSIERKEIEFKRMQDAMSKSMKKHGLNNNAEQFQFKDSQSEVSRGENWTLYLGDCVEEIKKLDDKSIDFSIYSPPFSELYVYSDNKADMGNSSNDDEFFQHYKYLIQEKHRITKDGRLSAVHCSDLPYFKGKDGFIGMKDFSGDIIKAHEECGWIYHSRITIWKNPVVEMQRTKAIGLLHKQFVKDSAMSRVGTPDYILVFRKRGENLEPIAQKREHGDYIGTDTIIDNISTNYSIDLWQRYASPVWGDIKQGNVLTYRGAKGDKDEKHVCPLQLDVIERCIDLWSNEGDTIFTPFAGIGSELVSALKMKRKAIGIELKENYYDWAIKHVESMEAEMNRPNFFDLVDEAAGD